jgi:hypothetical protein
MPFALITAGLIMIVVGAKGTHAQFGAALRNDFTGPGNFTWWLASIGAIGAIGYIEALRTLSHTFMALILVAMFLSNEGFFAKFQQALEKGPAKIGGTSAGSVATPAAPKTLEQHQSGAVGQAPQSEGQSKFNGWMNYFLGGGWLK